jgi:SAM-dependent methyltransferase
VLVAIASYGTGQDHYLREVVAGFRQLDMDCRIVVLSNIDKPVDGAEVLVGLPSRNTYSLPFAHRALFIKHASEYDLFIYTEDDTPITPANVRAFLEVQRLLPADHVAGFLRYETYPDGGRCIVSANHHFRWRPETRFAVGQDRFAQFSNRHSGCFVVTRTQLGAAIRSGGFTTEPRSGRYGMLETAASDIYTQCGLKRVICLTRIDDFIVPHLANKYYRTMGLPQAQFMEQVAALTQTKSGGQVAAWSLIEPETRAPEFRWSKHLYRTGGEQLLRLVPAGARKVLSIGTTLGRDEAALVARGVEVTVVPLDAVFGQVLRQRGFNVVDGPLPQAMAQFAASQFDAILADDVLHLLPDPLAWLRAAARVLAPEGEIVGTASNTGGWYWVLRDWRRGRWRWVRPDFRKWGAQPVSHEHLTALCCAGELELAESTVDSDEAFWVDRIQWGFLRRKLAPRLLFRIRHAC